jgi:hypothetical protein
MTNIAATKPAIVADADVAVGEASEGVDVVAEVVVVAKKEPKAIPWRKEAAMETFRSIPTLRMAESLERP